MILILDEICTAVGHPATRGVLLHSAGATGAFEAITLFYGLRVLPEHQGQVWWGLAPLKCQGRDLVEIRWPFRASESHPPDTDGMVRRALERVKSGEATVSRKLEPFNRMEIGE